MHQRVKDKKRPIVTSSRLRSIQATVLLFIGLLTLGGCLHLWHGQFFWGGYVAMAFFYAIMFYLGLAASRTDDNQLQELLLAGRSLPLGIALLTMTATWVGGGFINGTAESVASSGLAWAQAPWGYASV